MNYSYYISIFVCVCFVFPLIWIVCEENKLKANTRNGLTGRMYEIYGAARSWDVF